MDNIAPPPIPLNKIVFLVFSNILLLYSCEWSLRPLYPTANIPFQQRIDKIKEVRVPFHSAIKDLGFHHPKCNPIIKWSVMEAQEAIN